MGIQKKTIMAFHNLFYTPSLIFSSLEAPIILIKLHPFSLLSLPISYPFLSLSLSLSLFHSLSHIHTLTHFFSLFVYIILLSPCPPLSLSHTHTHSLTLALSLSVLFLMHPSLPPSLYTYILSTYSSGPNTLYRMISYSIQPLTATAAVTLVSTAASENLSSTTAHRLAIYAAKIPPMPMPLATRKFIMMSCKFIQRID